ncbi:hypothetical protein [Streptosporangium sp. NPDC000396]|uniref:hypothetical protein n=1 Tax=Streptosporangium sp. NPDC000396 TaxID=3366185 RepID=UPI0036CEF74C
MNRSLKVTRVLLVAAFVAGLSACSGEDKAPVPSEPPVTATSASPSVSVAASGTPEALASVSPPPSASPSPSDSPSEGNGLGIRGTDAVLLGDVQLQGADSITVAPSGEKARKVQLTPFTVVLDVQGAICDQGKLPHKCTVEQLVKALKGGASLYAKVTVKDGGATRIEEIVPE